MTDENTYTLKLTSAELSAISQGLQREYLWNRKQIGAATKVGATKLDIDRARTVRRNNKAVQSAAIKVKAAR